MTAKKVICKVCGKTFNRSAETCLFIPQSRRYAHLTCAEKVGLKGEIMHPPQPQQSKRQKEDNDLAALEEYILNLFNLEYITPRIRKQINQYYKDYHFSYNGILKTLKYWFEVRRESIENANEGIGIVPYVLPEAKEYYYHLFLAQESNKKMNFKSKERTIEIEPPQPHKKKVKLFFEEDEEKLDE